MPSTSKATNPHGIEVTFDEKSHIYSSIINGKEIKYSSGTGFVHSFFPEFDVDRIAPLSAKKEGCTVEEIKAKWKQAGLEAVTFGTRVHEVCEDILLDRQIRNTPLSEKEEETFNKAGEMTRRIKDRLEILGVEKIVFNEELQLAGTIDLFAKSKKDGTYWILDHKTNKTIDTANAYNEKALRPIEKLDNCNFNIYALQLNLYEFLLRWTGYVPPDAEFRRAILHHTMLQSRFIELPDYQNYIKDMMICFLSNKIQK